MHPGDQHLPRNDRAGQPNPYTPTLHTLSRASAQEIATLQAKLGRQLGPEYISERPGAAGVRVHYLEAWKCINLANEIFGFNGWSSSIQNISVDYMDETRETGRVSLGLSVVVRVTLKDGVYHEDVGYGSIENAKSKAAAFEKCKKEGTTDALKRALRNFGNVLGNCLYDKTYLREVSKIKLPPALFNVDRLHRLPEFAAPTKESKAPELPDPSVPNQPTIQPKANDDDSFQDHFDDHYFDDYDFEDRPDIGEECPWLDEFDTNSLPVIAPSAAAAGAKANVAAAHPPGPQQEAKANSRHAPGLVSAPHDDQSTNTSMPPAKSDPQPLPSISCAEYTPRQNNPNAQLPSSVSFSRLRRDGTPLGPFDAQAGNFSPLAAAKSDKVDYNKSARVFRSSVQQPKVPLNKSDAHNRLPQSPLVGAAPGGRTIGCPSARPMHNPPLHLRANSGPPSLGVKRNAQGQYFSDAGRMPNETSGDSGPKRPKCS